MVLKVKSCFFNLTRIWLFVFKGKRELFVIKSFSSHVLRTCPLGGGLLVLPKFLRLRLILEKRTKASFKLFLSVACISLLK